jgi:hypothetical protein
MKYCVKREPSNLFKKNCEKPMLSDHDITYYLRILGRDQTLDRVVRYGTIQDVMRFAKFEPPYSWVCKWPCLKLPPSKFDWLYQYI